MTHDDRGGPRRAPHETPGTVDHPRDDDRPSGQQLIHSDAACTIPWLHDGFQAVQVFVDTAVRERAQDICETLTGLVTRETSVDRLNDAIQRYARDNELSATFHEQPRDALSEGLVAVTFNLG